MKDNKKVWVIGIGPGSKDLIFPAAFEKMEEVDVILGSQRQLEIVPNHLQNKGRIPPWKVEELVPFIKEIIHQDKKVGILASGDPLFFGIGVTLKPHFPNELGIVAGLSSIGYFFNRLGLAMNDVYLSSCHGRGLDFQKLLSFSKIGLLTDKRNGPYQIAQELLALGGDYEMFIGENISYPEEKICRGSLSEIEDREYEMNVVILIRKESYAG